jgi:predicted AAA+ superfamily ATPase
MQGVSESLAGRVAIINLLGLSQRELSQHDVNGEPFVPTADFMAAHQKKTAGGELKSVFEKIWRGSFPAVALDNKMDRDLFYSSYVQTYLQRDVQALAKVGDSASFLKFLQAVAARTAQMLRLSELARDCDISPPTAKNWLSILEASGIICLLQSYHTNVTKRLIKAPKLYMLDTGLCSYLTQWSSPATLEAGAMSGAMFETYAVTEILKSWWHNGKQAPLYYYRDKDQKEIDLLIVQDKIIYPIEIKKTASPSRDSIRHFSVLGGLKMKIGHGALVCMTNQVLPISSEVDALPVSML